MTDIIVIPTYNEAKNIANLIEQIVSLDGNLQIVVVDDSSMDGTADIVEAAGRKMPGIHLVRRNGKKSFGDSYKDGFRYALSLNAEHIIQMDADLSHPPEYIADFLDAIKACDLVIGSRYKGGVRILNWPIHRLLLSLFANRYVKTLLGMPIEDCTSGYRCWNSKTLRHICMNGIGSNGYAFLVEMAYLAHKKGYRIKEIPIVFVEREQGVSKMSKALAFESALLPWRLMLRRMLQTRQETNHSEP